MVVEFVELVLVVVLVVMIVEIVLPLPDCPSRMQFPEFALLPYPSRQMQPVLSGFICSNIFGEQVRQDLPPFAYPA